MSAIEREEVNERGREKGKARENVGGNTLKQERKERREGGEGEGMSLVCSSLFSVQKFLPPPPDLPARYSELS